MATSHRQTRRGYRLFVLIVGLLVTLFICGSGGYFVRKYGALKHDLERLDREGVSTTGLVTDHSFDEGLFHVEADYRVLFAYSVDGRVYRGSSSVREADFDRAHVGDQVQIQYIPRDPTKARLEQALSATFAGYFYMLGWVTIAVGIFMFAFPAILLACGVQYRRFSLHWMDEFSS